MKNYIFNSVFQRFPKNIIDHYKCIIIWDVSLDITQIKKKTFCVHLKKTVI